MTNEKYLRIYLQDHHAGAVAGYQLAKRCWSNNKGTTLSSFLEDLIAELEEDIASLEDLMQRLGVAQSSVKDALGWISEKLGRLKLNGELTRYAPLSRVYELEALHVGVTAKLSLWRSLASSHHPAVGFTDVTALIERAERQQARLSEQHDLAAAETFG